MGSAGPAGPIGQSPAGGPAASGSRLLFVDNLRALMIVMVILVHLSITYGGAGSWCYKEVDRPDALTFSVLSIQNATFQSFFMGLLFLASGYFVPGSYDRKGGRRFVADRLLRLGIPLLCYDYVINLLVNYVLIRAGVVGPPRSFAVLARNYWTELHIGTGPLWFVETLLIFVLLYAGWRLAWGQPPQRAERDSYVPGHASLVALALGLGLGSFLVRIWLPVGWALHYLNLQLPFFPQYIVMFILGVLAYRHNWLSRLPGGLARPWLAVSVILVVVVFPLLTLLGGLLEGDLSKLAGGLYWQALAYALWEQTLGVGMTVALLLLFRERFNHQGTLARAASASSYTVYIIHAPIIVLFALAVRSVHLYPLLKFAIVASIIIPACFVLAGLVRRLPAAQRIL
jgi:glucan biosynthesis protein C